MVGLLEYWGESAYGRGRGTLDFDGDYTARRHPLWWVALKSLGALALIAVGFALMVPPLLKWLPLAKAIGIAGGVELIYLGAAFFLRPRPDYDNMGQPFFGGMLDDPLQYSDDINRDLFGLTMLLGPGRFIAETAVDAATWIGIVKPVEHLIELETTPEETPVLPSAERFEESRI